jgi:small conductance mechanosensitive channel
MAIDSIATMDLQPTLSALIVVGAELVLVAAVCALLYRLALVIVRRPAFLRTGPLSAWSNVAQLKIRNLLLAVSFAMAMTVLVYNGWLLARGVDAMQHTIALLRSITADTWTMAGVGVGKLALAVVAVLVITRTVRRILRAAEQGINRWDQLKANNTSLAVLFSGLDRMVVNLGWMLVAVFASTLVAAPQQVTEALALAVRFYVVFAVGLTVVRSASVVVDTLDGLSRRYAQRRDWLRHYDHLRPLLPTFRACLEYALWIGLASLLVVQLPPIRDLAVWGPRLIQAIAIFFASRVVIELGHLELGRRMLPGEGLDETERRRRATMVPLVRTAFTYSVYFAAAVLALGALGFNPMPFLAGAGILGLVVGFGAQALINDIVSGFFILFENTYLVGETIEVGDAKGLVEAIDFRTTKIRDGEGRLHIIRNGDMKPIVNYSRDYTVAVVDVTVGYDADLRAVFNALCEAADRMRAGNVDVLAETEVEGVVAFGTRTMTVRTQTRVRPGRSDAVAAALRFAIKEVFDGHAGDVPRRMLIPKPAKGRPRRSTAAQES